MSVDADLVSRRSHLLATVVLTRRLNIDVFPLDQEEDRGLDLLGTIRSEKVPGFLPFGVVVWGTAKVLNTTDDVARFVRSHRRKLDKRSAYFIPVILLFFSMHKDEAFFAWLVEPCEGGIQLMNVPFPEFTEFDLKQLDAMINRITDWYKRLQATLLATATEGTPHRPDDE